MKLRYYNLVAILICHCEASLRRCGNLNTMRSSFGYELPKIECLFKRLMTADGLTVAMKSEYLQDNA